MKPTSRPLGLVLLSAYFLTGFANNAPTPDSSLQQLTAYERNTIDVFQKASANVVYVERLTTVKKEQVPDGTGSGIIWDKAGHIVTNYHVIHGAHKLAITVGKITLPAKMVGAEPRKDIAVLSVDSNELNANIKDFIPFSLAPTHELLVGQKAIAIGNPYGLDHTLTVGVVSALNREFPGIGGVSIHEVIQTDAAINPGNSGGPLLDSRGRLIGLNTAIYSPSGGSTGIGFTVPADTVERVVNQIIQHGRVIFPGIGIKRMENEQTTRLGVKKGVVVENVLPNTPAAAVGLRGIQKDRWGHVQVGDVIIAVNGKTVRDYDMFYNILNTVNVGETVKIAVLRDNKKLNYHIKTIDIAAF